jgi:transcriptional regulator with GAF, ATPase, and Fis domain
VGPEVVQAAMRVLAREPSAERALTGLAATIASRPDVALARVWLMSDERDCAICSSGPPVVGGESALHLVASSGTPRAGGEDWGRLDGAFHRTPPGVGKVGKIGASGTGMLLHDMTAASSWIVRPEWAAREGIRAFAAQPLVASGRTAGVLAVFCRRRLDAAAFGWLRTIADAAAAVLAHAHPAGAAPGRPARGVAPDVLAGDSLAGSRLREQVALAAGSDRPVVIAGEAGTGRVEVARRIHAASSRASRPFRRVRCAVRLPDAFEADLSSLAGGTLLLDEVAGLAPAMQVRLARNLASAGSGPESARIVATTSRDLRTEAAAGRFDPDLYQRLSVVSIGVPSLRERRADVGALAEDLARRMAARRNLPAPVLAGRERQALERYSWPGNLAELAGVVALAFLRATDGRLRFAGLVGAPPVGEAASGGDVIPAIDMRRRERTNVEAALARSGGRIYGPGGAAELLGVPPTTLASRVKALGIARARTPARGEV